jgi:formylglycine-generating enzyme required for sulfatase activity
MAVNELTHAEWMACVEDGGCSHTPDHRVLVFKKGYVPLGPNHPVINVSYLDALEYVAWLNGRVGAEVYRLPTEAEWEYAARSGTQTRFAQGDELTADQANFSRAATEHLRQLPKRVELPHLTNRRMPVSVHELDAANAWGLRHMSGNVAELTLSCWTEEHLGLASDSAYLRLAQSESQSHCRRVAKGGAFTTAMDGVRPASRNRPTETYRRDHLGFRLVREMTKEERK